MKNKKPNNPNIVFFGTPEFAKSILNELIVSEYKPILVVSAPDKPVGRKQKLTPSPVKILAKKNNILVLQPKKLDSAFINNLKLNTCNLFIVAAYGKFLPKDILEIPKFGSINVHPSLLPHLRGPSPIQYAILQGDKFTGTSIMLMDEQMDHGPILAQEKFKILHSDTAEILSKKLAKQGGELLIKIIPQYIKKGIKPKTQEHVLATYSKIIIRENGKINWYNTAEDIEKQYRAFKPWPGIFTFWEGKRLKIISLKNIGRSDPPIKVTKPGRVIKYKNSFAIEAKNDFIVPLEVQFEGKKEQSAQEFLRGHPEIIDSLLI